MGLIQAEHREGVGMGVGLGEGLARGLGRIRDLTEGHPRHALREESLCLVLRDR